jgi:cytochrome c biogenesis protein CcmG/thiol:disulfide interchange protein DsbE
MNPRLRMIIPAAVFMVMAGLLYFGLNPDRQLNFVPSALVNRPLPVFTLPDLFDEQGTISSNELTGNIFLVNVWGTWCPPCHQEHPYLVEISAREPQYTWIGVNYKDDLEDARDFLDERGNPFARTIVDIDGSLGIDFGVTAAPETFIVDSSGTIRYRHVGPINNEIWAQTFKPILAQLQ